MKLRSQEKDRNTIDIFTGKAGVGRPRKYSSNAAKQKAYRLRLKQEESKNAKS